MTATRRRGALWTFVSPQVPLLGSAALVGGRGREARRPDGRSDTSGQEEVCGKREDGHVFLGQQKQQVRPPRLGAAGGVWLPRGRESGDRVDIHKDGIPTFWLSCSPLLIHTRRNTSHCPSTLCLAFTSTSLAINKDTLSAVCVA